MIDCYNMLFLSSPKKPNNNSPKSIAPSYQPPAVAASSARNIPTGNASSINGDSGFTHSAPYNPATVLAAGTEARRTNKR